MTYKFSQDHIELLFGVIRLRLQCNDNRIVFQFCKCIKKILLKNDLKPSAASNCLLFDPPAGGIFDISLRCRVGRRKGEVSVADESWEEDFQELPTAIEAHKPTDNFLRNNMLYYISGFITMKLIDRISCQSYCEALLKSKQCDHNYAKIHKFLTRFKDRGGLKMASDDVYVVKETERQLCPYYNKLVDLYVADIIKKVKNNVALNCSFGRDCIEEDFFRSHKLLLVHNICLYYIKINMYSITKKYSLQLRMSIRNKNKKIEDFQNL